MRNNILRKWVDPAESIRWAQTREILASGHSPLGLLNAAWLVIILLLSLPFTSVTLAELPDCKETWEDHGLRSSEYLYDYDRDHLLTDVGNEGYDDFYASLNRQQCQKEWLVVIYMNADNDLTLASYADLYEMENVGSTANVDVIVYHDSNDDTGSRYLHIALDPAAQDIPLEERRLTPDDFLNLMDFEDEDILSPVVQWLPEQNSGDINVFLDFAHWAHDHYPARHVAVILWSHGMGWVAKLGEEFDTEFNEAADHVVNPLEVYEGLSSLEPEDQEALPPEEQEEEPFDIPEYDQDEPDIPRKISFDHSSDMDGNAYITIPQLRDALEELRKANHAGDPFDVLGADACLMMSLEVAYELRHEAKYFVGSASAEGTMGWPYTDILLSLNELIENETRNVAYHWAKSIPELYVQSYSGEEDASQKKDRRALMVALNAQALERTVGPILNQFGSDLLDYIQEYANEEGQRYDEVRALIGKTFSFSGVTQDLFHFTVLINNLISQHRQNEFSESPAARWLDQSTDNLQDTISRHAVIGKAVSPYYFELMSAGVSKGISIWLPASNQEYRENRRRFAQSELFWDPENPDDPSGWAKFNDYIHSKDGLQGVERIDDYRQRRRGRQR